MLVAERLRDGYFTTTIALADALRELALEVDGPLGIASLPEVDLDNKVVAFVDGGIGRINLNVAVPVIVRAGIFRVREGDTDLETRESFAHFPLLLGELDGGLKSDRDYATVVRLLVEAMAVRTVVYDPAYSDVDLVMLHGPLVWLADPLFRHWFPEPDLHRILGGSAEASSVLSDFQGWCGRCRFDGDEECRASRAAGRTPAMCLLAYLLDDIVEGCRETGKLVCGVVERSNARGLIRRCLVQLARTNHPAFAGLASQLGTNGNRRASAVFVEELLEATRYRDAMLLSLTLRRGEYTRPEPLSRGAQDRRQTLFPGVLSTYLRPTRSRPMRVEFPEWASPEERLEILARVYSYSDLLPGYAFPLGLDIADKFTAIPGWMTKAFETHIRWEYGRLMAGMAPQLGHLADHLFFEQGRSRELRPVV